MDMPEYLTKPEVFHNWMGYLLKIYVLPVTKDMNPTTGNILISQIPLVKCQKWISRIFLRLFQRLLLFN